MLLHMNRLQFSVNTNLYALGNEKNDSIFCNISFIAAVWNQNHNISEAVLYRNKTK